MGWECIPLPLTYFLLLEKVSDYGSVDTLVEAGISSWKIHDEDLRRVEIGNELERLRKRIQFRCQGFLEVKMCRDFGLNYEGVKLTHRSVADFFHGPHFKHLINTEPTPADWIDLLCLCVLAQAKLTLASDFSFFLGHSLGEKRKPADPRGHSGHKNGQ